MADRVGEYKLRLTAKNAQGAVSSSDVVLTVRPNAVALGASSTPLDHLKSLIQPVFKQGHTLLPLSKSSCGVAPDIDVELMKHWGYSAQFTARPDGALFSPDDPIANAVKSSPGRYPIEVTYASFYGYYDNYLGNRPGYPVLPAATWLRDAQGEIILHGGRPIVSPAAPDETAIIIGRYGGKFAAEFEAALGQPIRLVTNAGESGIWLFGDNDPSAWYGRDPSVQKDFEASGLTNWYDYNARNRARIERLIKETILGQLSKGRPVYSLYQDNYGTERGRWWGWNGYIFRWEQFIGSDGKPLVSDYSSPEMYYQFANSGWSGVNGNSMVPWDALTLALKNVGGTLQFKQRNFYPWVSMGWDGGDSGGISENDLFLGMMKMYYTAGAIGAVSGYFTCAGAPFQAMRLNQPVGTVIPTQIRGNYLLGHAHALFSHLEEYLRDGELLPGPNQHPFRDSTEITPAMEFPAEGETKLVDGTFGAITIPTARVLARKINNQDRWLISAWANTGSDRDIAVTIDPKLGRMTLKARRAGSVYLAELKGSVVSLRLVDDDGMNPTRSLFP